MKTSIFDMNFTLPPLVEITVPSLAPPLPLPTFWLDCIF